MYASTEKWLQTIIAVAVLASAFALSIWYSLTGSIDHDEHLFMAAAHLVAQDGLQPYHDFAYFHMPNLVYVYALFSLFSQPLLLARIFVGICAGGICAAIYLASLSACRDRLSRIILPAASVAILVLSPLFRYTVTHVWNHTPATIFAITAMLFHIQALRGNNSRYWYLFSGIALGMALGIRLSYAPLIIPFLLFVLFNKERAAGVAMFAMGGLSANLPSLYYFFADHQNFMFGNLGYAELNTLYRKEMSFAGPMTLAGKFDAMKNIVYAGPGHRALLALTAANIVLIAVDSIKKALWPRQEVVFALLLLPFVYIGVLAPTPSWYQYFFATIPFLILFNVFAVSSFHGYRLACFSSLLFVLTAVVGYVHFSPPVHLSPINKWLQPETCYPTRVHQEAVTIRALIDSVEGEGAVLTLSPIYITESGLPIFKEFAAGPFAWRVSHLIPEDEAALRGMPLRSRIRSFIEQNHPRAILTGKEYLDPALEEPIIQAAQDLGYQQNEGPGGSVVWLRTGVASSPAVQ